MNRFAFIEDLDDQIKEKTTPRNTVKNTKWCVNIWNGWAKERNKRLDKQDFPFIPNAEDITKSITERQLMFFLKRFVSEVRTKEGQAYAPETLKVSICYGLQRYLKENGWPTVDFMNSNQEECKEFRIALDTRCQNLMAEGIGTKRLQPKEITDEQEDMLWDKGILNTNTSQGLSNCVLFYTCKLFGVRTGYEHKRLRLSQFTFGNDVVGKYVQLNGHKRKLATVGVKTKPEHLKSVKHYQHIDNSRCYYNILETYISRIPKVDDIFYFRPGHGSLYCSVPLGLQPLERNVAKMMKKANVVGFYTNRSVNVMTESDACYRYCIGHTAQHSTERRQYSPVIPNQDGQIGHKSSIEEHNTPENADTNANVHHRGDVGQTDHLAVTEYYTPVNSDTNKYVCYRGQLGLVDRQSVAGGQYAPLNLDANTELDSGVNQEFKRKTTATREDDTNFLCNSNRERELNNVDHSVKEWKRKAAPSPEQEIIFPCKIKREREIDNVNISVEESVDIHNECTNVVLDTSGNKNYGNLNLNLDEVFQSECELKPSNVKITREKDNLDKEYGLITIQIQYSHKDK